LSSFLVKEESSKIKRRLSERGRTNRRKKRKGATG